MKVAVCISGLPRAVEKCYPDIERKVLEPYNPDVFMHLWGSNVENINGRTTDYYEEAQLAEELYNPIECKIVTPSNSLLRNYMKDALLTDHEIKGVWRDKRRNCLSMFRGIFEANSMKVQHALYHNIEYTQSFRLRTDISMRNLEIKFDNTVHIPSRHKKGVTAGGYEDTVAWGPSRAMDWYSALYFYFGDYETSGRKDPKTFWNSHVMLKKHLDIMQRAFPITLVGGIDLRKRI